MHRKLIMKIKEKGVPNLILFAICETLYRIIAPIIRIYLNHFARVKNNKVLFYSKPDYYDNCKYMYQYLSKCYGSNMNYVWLVENIKNYKNTDNTTFVQYSSKYHRSKTLKAMKQIATSEYIFFSHGSPMGKFEPISNIYKKDGQLIVNLWHGCGYKDAEKVTGNFGDLNFFDIMLVPGEVFVETKAKFWKCAKEKIKPWGYPRYDLLLHDNIEAQTYANELIQFNRKLVVWMPTFRKTKDIYKPESKIRNDFDLPLLNSVEQVECLNDICNKLKIMLCVKRHPNQLEYECEKNSYSNISFVSNKDFIENNVELYNFLRYTDALISDYSSVSVDYMLLQKPIAYTLDDYNEYKQVRGFVFDNPLEYMPGFHLYTFSDLHNFLISVSNDEDCFASTRKSLFEQMQTRSDNYCADIWRNIENVKKH